jgi:hypothetical protein
MEVTARLVIERLRRPGASPASTEPDIEPIPEIMISAKNPPETAFSRPLEEGGF